MKEKKFKRYYEQEEKEEIAKEVTKNILDNYSKEAIDKILNFSKEAIKNPKTIDFIVFEDIYSKQMFGSIRSFSMIKKAAKYKALDALLEIIEFEKNIISEYSNKIKYYIDKDICEPQQKKYRMLKKSNDNKPKQKQQEVEKIEEVKVEEKIEETSVDTPEK